MENPKVENKVPKVEDKVKVNNNYTPYRKNYNKAKSLLVKKFNKEFKEILVGLNGKK